MSIDTLLCTFSYSGVRLGLESIRQLLTGLGNPHEQVPVIHVAGSNGKGSVCAYLSSILTEAGYRVGRYTSPHLVDWTERICLNGTSIPALELTQLLQTVSAAARSQDPQPTQFEVITAAAWLYFAQQKVDVAVMEVGLGGRLDATNVCDYPLVSVITSISREHWQRLGPTLGHIAWEKAGILKPGCPAVVGQVPPEAAAVIHRRATELDCVTTFPTPARALGNGWAEYRGVEEYELGAEDDQEVAVLHLLKTIRYPLPLQGAIQLHNSAIAIAAIQILREQGWQVPEEAIANGIAKTRWAGRLQWFTWQTHTLLIDGAHNPASAEVLRQFVDQFWKDNTTRANDDKGDIDLSFIHDSSALPIHWVIGMLGTKDHADVFKALLRPGDSLYLAPLPDSSTADPAQLTAIAQAVCPALATCQPYADVFLALEAATQQANHRQLVVLSGSLYLIGHFFKQTAASY